MFPAMTDEAEGRGDSRNEKNELARLMTTEMRKTYRAAVDEAVKCSGVCRYHAENAHRFLADDDSEQEL
jgi:succinate-semialdehyde dehydrogenase/glutarate-semialdehyde dehydrogenase